MITTKYLLTVCLIIYSVSVFAHGIVHQQIDELTLQIKRNPTNTKRLLKRAQLYADDQNWLKAQQDFNSVRELNSSASVVDLLEAKMWFANNRPVLSYPLVNRYLENNPNVPAALALRGKVGLLLGKADAAVTDFASVVEQSKTVLPDMYLQWAKAQARVKPLNQQRVHQIVQSGLEKLGSLVVLLDYAIEFDRQQQDYASALSWLGMLPPQLINQPHWLFKKGRLLKLNNQPSAAKEQYKLALSQLQYKKLTGRFHKADEILFDKINQQYGEK